MVYTPNQNFNGSDSFFYVSNDGTTTSALTEVSLVITPINDAPEAIPQSLSLQEDSSTAVVFAGGRY